MELKPFIFVSADKVAAYRAAATTGTELAEKIAFLGNTGLIMTKGQIYGDAWSGAESTATAINDIKTLIGTLPADQANVIAYINSLVGTVKTIEGQATGLYGYIDAKVSADIAALVDNADEKYDTLKEIADWIKNDETGTADIVADITALQNAVGSKATKDEEGKDVPATGLYGDIAEIKEAIGLADTTTGTSLTQRVAELESTVNDEETGVAANANAISALNATVGDANSGLVKGVADNKAAIKKNEDAISALNTTVNDESTGLVKKVADNTTAINTNASDISALKTAVGDETSGLVKGVADNATAITALQNALNAEDGLAAKVAANTSNISDIKTEIGVKASEGVNATGIYKYIDEKSNITIGWETYE